MTFVPALIINPATDSTLPICVWSFALLLLGLQVGHLAFLGLGLGLCFRFRLLALDETFLDFRFLLLSDLVLALNKLLSVDEIGFCLLLCDGLCVLVREQHVGITWDDTVIQG